jgi:aspartyl-tRNA(Asn)/glutamyl-tRNA(Gln) amidotransferase subunit B
MEEGSLRCDANISTRREGREAYGTRVEIKNLNSIRSLERALRHEEDRQRAALDAGEAVVQETRHFDENTGRTHTLRSKEEAFDYRYFPEPDLPPLEPDEAWIERIRASLPELPAARRARYAERHGLTGEQASTLAANDALARLFNETLEASAGASGSTVANWVTQNLVAVANDRGLDLENVEVDAVQIAAIIGFVGDGTISATAGKQVLDEVVTTGKPAEQIVDEHGLRQVSDTSQLEAWADEAIAENPGPVQQFRSGKDGAINALVGQVMQRSRGSANPQVVQQILRQRLSGS